MKNELALYGSIYSSMAENLIAKMNEIGDNEDIEMRINSGGGDVMAGWGIAAKMQERDGKTKLKIDGIAASMAAQLCFYSDDVEALDVSTIGLHRADMYVETDEDQEFLDRINTDLRSHMESRIDSKKLKDISGLSIKNLFEDEDRKTVMLTGKQAKDIGMVHKVIKLKPKEVEALYDKYSRIAASYTPAAKTPAPKNKKTKSQKKERMTKMNVEAFKAKYPKTYAKVFNSGISAEKERVESCMVFIDVDAKGVKAAIESGKPLSAKQMSEFALKQNSPDVLAKIAKEAAAKLATGAPEGEAELTPKEKELAAFEVEARKLLKLK